jgi:segregation and condensation protein B
MESAEVQRLLEGALFAASGPLSAAKLADLGKDLTAADIREAVKALNEKYTVGSHAFVIEEIAGGFRLLTARELGPQLANFFATRAKERLSRAALEVLAIVAYKQPATRAVIDSIRGVASDSVVANLTDLGLIRVSGQSDAPGRPMLYSTTRKFLDHFGLKSLRDLPKEKEFDVMEQA